MLYKIAQKAGFSFQKAMTDPSTFLLSYGTVEKFSLFPFSFEISTNITSKTVKKSVLRGCHFIIISASIPL